MRARLYLARFWVSAVLVTARFLYQLARMK